MAKIYTKQGDTGHTTLFDGTRVPKNDLRMHMLGELDELNSLIGVANSSCRHQVLRMILTTLQHHLFDLGAEIATPKESPAAKNVRTVSDKHVALLEMYIDKFSEQLPMLKGFILPGGSATAAHLHLARAVCRRAERTLTHIRHQSPAGYSPIIMQYLNRLSDLLFTLARAANQLDEIPDVPWQPESEV